MDFLSAEITVNLPLSLMPKDVTPLTIAAEVACRQGSGIAIAGDFDDFTLESIAFSGPIDEVAAVVGEVTQRVPALQMLALMIPEEQRGEWFQHIT